MMAHQDRLQAFHELRQTIRSSDSMLVVGIDVAKNNHRAFFGTAPGKTLWKKLLFDNSLQGFQSLQTLAPEKRKGFRPHLSRAPGNPDTSDNPFSISY